MMKKLFTTTALALACVAASAATPTVSNLTAGRTFDQVTTGTVGYDGIFSNSNLQWAFEGQYVNGAVVYDSYLLMFDPKNNASTAGRKISADVTFNGNVVEIIKTTSALISSSTFLTSSPLGYKFASAAGLEGNDSSVALGSNGVSLKWNATNPGDYTRVLVMAPVPEPETYAMLLAGLGLMGAIARRRAKKLQA